jgi:hypothetical protein
MSAPGRKQTSFHVAVANRRFWPLVAARLQRLRSATRSALAVRACHALSALRFNLPQASFRFRPIHSLAQLDMP